MINNPTHKVVITISSYEDLPDVTLSMQWSPLLGDDEILELGYTPASYQLAEQFLLATEAMIDLTQLLEIDEGDLDAGRVIN